MRVVRMVEIAALPEAPEIVMGVIDVQGEIIPVMSMRRRFGLTEPGTSLSDQLIVADTATCRVALSVNSVTGVVERAQEDITETAEIVPGSRYVEGISTLEDGLVFIHDLDLFLSKKEAEQLEEVLAKGVTRGAGARA